MSGGETERICFALLMECWPSVLFVSEPLKRVNDKRGRERDEVYSVGKTKKEKKSKEGFDNIDGLGNVSGVGYFELLIINLKAMSHEIS